ncbi:glycosyltransferase family 4 protein [Sulfitobacter pontiacus]|uniref:glycosyltransferase family 4 protein n=1 Tax=Sulfitobacter pontiacus TaxID=60137 RepID=UPI0030EB9F3E
MKRNSLRILMINDHLHFGGGGDAVFRIERNAYEQEGFDVSTFSLSSKLFEGSMENNYVFNAPNSRFASKFGKFVGAPMVRNKLLEVLRDVRPHLVRVHLVSKLPLSIYSALIGWPVVQTLHGPNLFCATSWGNVKQTGADCSLGIGAKCWKKGCVSLPEMMLYSQMNSRLQPVLRSAIETYHCPSRFIQKKAEGLGLGNTFYLPLGIDKVFTDPVPAKQDASRRLIFVGSLVEQKGVQLLPEILELVTQVFPDTSLAICGRGPLENYLKCEFTDKGLLNNVEFKGFASPAQLSKEYRKSSVFVLPSLWAEQFGLVGVEALASGLPCVASDTGGIPEWLINGRHGYLVKRGDVRQFSNALIELLGDREKRLCYGSMGRKFSLNVHDGDVYGQHWVDIAGSYRSSLSENSKLSNIGR